MAEHIETILDYNPTAEEWTRLGGEEFIMKYREIYLQSHSDNHNYHLGLLFAMRGDKSRANKYWQKVENEEMLKTLWQDF